MKKFLGIVKLYNESMNGQILKYYLKHMMKLN